jgi:signal transduction histidine kinase
LLPSLLAVLLAVGLAYYGEYNRAAPGLIVFSAGVLAIASLVVTWLNTRYLAARIVRLTEAIPNNANGIGAPGGADEFDQIERAVGHLGSALSASEAERARANAAAATRLRDEATMLAAVVHDTMAQLDEVRLPLHILLETRFGELNENQEELLRDARNASDAIGTALRRLALVADADRGALSMQRELVQVNDVVRAILPLARAAAERQKARVETSLEPGLPRVLADRARLAEALTLLAVDAATRARPDRPLGLTTRREIAGVSVTITPSAAVQSGEAAATKSPDVGGGILARRLIAAQGGMMEDDQTALVVRLGAAAGP